MILPPKYRLAFALMLTGIAVLMLASGAWALFLAYGDVLTDAASGASSELSHLNDIYILQSAVLAVAVVVSAFLSIALVALYAAERRIERNAKLIADGLKAYALGDWSQVPHVHPGDALDEVAEAAAGLAAAMQTRGRLDAGSKEAEEIKTRFLEIISHQLRTPLTAVRWNLESLLRGEEGDLNRKQSEVLRITDKNYQNILVMLSDWIEALEVERGLLQLNPESIDVAPFLKAVAAEFKSQANLKDLTLRLEIAKGLPDVYADRLKFHYILSKLAHNAISYTSEGGRVTLRAKAEGKMVRFEVEDSGVGIPVSEQREIFKKFFRASNAALMQPYASGVGLFVAKTLIDAHGGAIGFRSEEGRGTTFTFSLPVSDSSRPKPPSYDAPAARRPRRPAVPSRNGRRRA